MNSVRLDKNAAVVAEGFARVGEACKFLGVSTAKLYELMGNGELRYAKIGKSRRIPWADLHRFASASLIG